MIWYSANNDSILKSSTDFKIYEDSFYDLPDIKTHYVWTESQKAKIQRSNQSNIEIKVVGSIIFEPRDLTLKAGLNSYPIITYFDVTPTIHMYFQESFYSERNMIENLTTVVNSVHDSSSSTGKNLVLRIKPKRRPLKGHHSLKYQQVLDTFADNGDITVLQSDQNMYSLIKGSDLVISVPFSSPCLIAKELKVPAIYFSANREYLLGSSHEGIEVIVSAEALRRYLIDLFGQLDC
jgi:polysaccharide biosynthesis PFTS motif protein